MRIILLLGVINLFSACGRSKGGSSGVTTPVMAAAVIDSASLPTCGDSNKNQLIYVTEEKLFKTCSGVVWEDITLPESKIRASIHCSGVIDDTGPDVYYDASWMTSGDIFVTGRISGDVLSVSNSLYFSSQQVGASNPGVTLTYDAAGTDNGGWWDISLNFDTLEMTVVYNDSDVSGSKQTWTMPADKCKVNDYTK